MIKKLVTKTQFLKPILPDFSKSFSSIFVIEPDTEELTQKRGTVYGVLNIVSDDDFDTNLIGKVTHDILYENYFHSDNISPTQSLEAAINNLKDKVANLSNESIRQDKQPIRFNIISAVLWGNVVYVVQYGSAHSFLVRGGAIKPINKLSEGAFSAASGVVHDDDVIILCSKSFGQKYPPNKIINAPVDATQLELDEAGILIKFKIDTSFSQNEVVNFGLEDLPKRKDSKLRDLLKKVKLPKIVLPKIQLKPRNKPSPTIDRVVNIDKLTPTILNSGIKLRSPGKFDYRKLLKPQFLILVTVLALAGALSYAVKNRAPAEPAPVKQTEVQEIPTPIVEGTTATAKEEPDEEVFYDLKIVDSTAVPAQIVVFNNTIAVTDKNNGKIYLSNFDTAKFEAIEGTFAGISNAFNIGGELGFTDPTGFKTYNLASNKITQEYTKTGLELTSYYLSYVYSVEDDKIFRYAKSGEILEGTLWGQNQDFDGARSLAVAFNIYVLTSNGEIVKYAAGEKVKFDVDTTKVTFSNPTQLVTDLDYDNIYVLDKGNKRIVVLNKDGAFVKEIKAQKESRWDNLTSISVSPDEKIMFVLNGTRVYKVSL